MTYESAEDLADALRRASEAHGKHEERTGQADENWPDWYALYHTRLPARPRESIGSTPAAHADQRNHSTECHRPIVLR